MLCRVEKVEWVKNIKNENGILLKTHEELVEAFRRRLIRKFNINEGDNYFAKEKNEM